MPDIRIDLPLHPRYRIFKHNGRWHAVDTRTGIRLANRATWISALRAVDRKIAAGRRELARVTRGDFALAAGGHR
ncbi:hypothetical protein GS907_24490 [Rhodococcus hoagii]|nr:hypothetical protein [Prescottella equi]